jgi:hypothetical protein
MTTRYYQRSEDKIGKEMLKGYRKDSGDEIKV